MLNAVHLQPLLAGITLAEEISRDVSARQAELAPAPLASVLAVQSRQEAVHAVTFRAALQCLPPGPPCPPAVERALLAYRSRLMADLDDGRLAASIVGLQCVLERLGCVALQPPPGQLARMADRIVPLRAFVLHQEAAHRNLGDAWAGRLGAAPRELFRACEEYVDLARSVLETGLRSLSCLAPDAGHYRAAVRGELEQVRLAIAGPPQPRRSLK